MDAAIVEYFHELFLRNDGRGKSTAQAVLFGVEMYLQRYRGKLRASRLALKGWSNLRPSRPFPPMPKEVMSVVAVQMAKNRGFGAGLAVLVAFDALLRVSELTCLLKQDVRQVSGFNTPSTVVLHIKTSKTGTNQLVTIRDPAVAKFLMLHVKSLKHETDKVFSCEAWQFRQWFKDAVYHLGLSSNFVPHSLRHGAATELLIAGEPMETILERGRWASTKTARHYIQVGRTLLLFQDTPERVRTLGQVFYSNIGEVLYRLYDPSRR